MLVAVDIDFTPFLSNFRILDFIRIFEGFPKMRIHPYSESPSAIITHQRPKTCEKRRGARSQRAVSALVPTLVPHILVHNGLAANVDAPLHLVRPPRRRRPRRAAAKRPANPRLRRVARPPAPERRRPLDQRNRGCPRPRPSRARSPVSRVLHVGHLPRGAGLVARYGQVRNPRAGAERLPRADPSPHPHGRE